ncbi:hypothetical protein HMPREF3213_00493 [Heyndrickxia coagulans]|uniref:Uncharacterized protein n=1 Tax=Heyndrickxia coagulans TaxID=1398 RepID=A0A133L0C9_HEYCO|nr:hypothetical protein HMPREF3213_00493 [Heyndrickxia coagulans]
MFFREKVIPPPEIGRKRLHWRKLAPFFQSFTYLAFIYIPKTYRYYRPFLFFYQPVSAGLTKL